jgi:histidinol-phosphate/aromatic aminotransferase/cobyric acid decarboxylase-like protein
MHITVALLALSLRAIQSNRKPHISEREIRLHHAMWRRPLPRLPKSGARFAFVKEPAPSTASLAAMSRYFES